MTGSYHHPDPTPDHRLDDTPPDDSCIESENAGGVASTASGSDQLGSTPLTPSRVENKEGGSLESERAESETLTPSSRRRWEGDEGGGSFDSDSSGSTSFTPSGVRDEDSGSLDPESPQTPESEKDRVLRKVLGDKYKNQGGGK